MIEAAKVIILKATIIPYLNKIHKHEILWNKLKDRWTKSDTTIANNLVDIMTKLESNQLKELDYLDLTTLAFFIAIEEELENEYESEIFKK